MERFCIQNPPLLSCLLVLLLFIFNCFASSKNNDVDEQVRVRVRVGLVLDLGSVEGKIVRSSVSMALSDFYAIHNDYKTRVSLSVRNSHGEPLLTLASAVDLLQTEGVEAIIGGNSLLEAKLLGELGEKARVPMISLDSPISCSLSKYNHLIQATHDSASEAKGITSFINGFDWNSVALVYEDHDDWKETMQLLVDHFHENNIRVKSKIGFTVSSSEDSMMDRLRKLNALGTTVFVVHLSKVMATYLFPCAEKLGMMGEGFAWILTAKSMNSFHESIDDFAKETMEGVVGFKSYIPMSKELHNFTLRWRKSLHVEEVIGTEITRLSISGIWAHDIAWALASAAEVIRMPNVTSTLLEAITESKFIGLSGDFQLDDRKLVSDKFEIVNMIGSGERRIGFWNFNGSFSNRRHLSSTHNNLETIIWPGGSTQSPKGSSLKQSDRKKLRVLVTSSNRFPRLVNVTTDPVTHDITNVDGFCIEVFNASIARFNYEVEYIRWRNGSNYDNLAYVLNSQVQPWLNLRFNASDHFRAKDYETSAEMFEKSMLYIPHDIENRVFRAKGFRVLCLCYLGLSQLDRALEYIEEAEKLEPNIACSFLKFKIYLQKKEHSCAIAQIDAMMSCLDFSPDYLSLSAHEAISCQALPVAVASLSKFLSFCISGKTMPTTEVVVFRTLVTILTQDIGSETEALNFMLQAQSRASKLGTECFFGSGETGKREQNWFAVTCWNLGSRCGNAKKYELCGEFLRLASEFYSYMDTDESGENIMMICRSIILSVTAMIALEKQNKSALTETQVKLAAELLVRAGKIMSSSLSNGKDCIMEPELNFMYTLLAYDIHGRLNNSAFQLLVVKTFAGSKSCHYNYLLQLGIFASQSPQSNPDVSTFALNECLSALIASASPDYPTIALIIRKLISISSIHKGDTNDEEAILKMYKQAYRIMVGLKEGEYPTEEGKWLAMTAWNRAALPVRLGQFETAKKWLSMGLEIAEKVTGMDTYKACMQDYLAGFQTKVSSA